MNLKALEVMEGMAEEVEMISALVMAPVVVVVVVAVAQECNWGELSLAGMSHLLALQPILARLVNFHKPCYLLSVVISQQTSLLGL